MRVPRVSQHFWHCMMGELLPVVSEILKHGSHTVYLIKEHYATCPFTAFYSELPFRMRVIDHQNTVSDGQPIQSPLCWHMYNHGEQHKLIHCCTLL